MKNGDISEFIDQLYYGGELVFEYESKKHFLQGWTKCNTCKMVLDIVSGAPFHSYLWEYEAETMKECAEAFLAAPLWNGKDFQQVQEDVIWSDW